MPRIWTAFSLIVGSVLGVVAGGAAMRGASPKPAISHQPTKIIAEPPRGPARLSSRPTRVAPSALLSRPTKPHAGVSGLPALVRGGMPSPSTACPSGMQLVQGNSCPYVSERCVDWIDPRRDRCREYAPDPRCIGRPRPMRFCIDRYEYPNQKGVYPAVMVDFLQAQAACKAEGKRLCTDKEWTFACEGTERRPYPYGFERDATACNIDRPYRFPDLRAFSHRRDISAELSRLDQRVQSGSMPRCVSPFGVYDMTGNVDEWVVNTGALRHPSEDHKPDISGLKGGYFGPVRDRCRPMTTDHNRWFRFYQVGFRCCASPTESN